MGGGLMQLVAYGAQDIYLTGNPQITFFKVVYRRHTNFAMESVAQTFDGVVKAGACVSATISRNGDLVHRVYLEIDGLQGDNEASTPLDTFKVIDYVELEVGGQLIDRHYGDWMSIWCELTHSASKALLLNGLSTATKTWIPLQFAFCRNPGLAIPLIALQYHEVKISVKFGTIPTAANVCMWCDYIYLDTDERRRFAQTSHEYLIEQVQSNRKNNLAAGCVNKVALTFNHPVKELVWRDTAESNITSGVLKLNGHERFSKRHGEYFSRVQRYQHHTGAGHFHDSATPAVHATDSMKNTYVYSFALQPEEHQPSGTCNMSRIDNAVLELEAAAASCVDIYAVNYNVLRVMSGMGGLAYSN